MKKKSFSRILSLFLTAVFLLNTSVMLASAEDAMTIQVSTVNAAPGETVQVQISLVDNPGISSLKLNVEYDEVLTLTNVEFDGAFGAYATAPLPFSNPQTLSCISPMVDLSVDGTFATLTFVVAETAVDGTLANVELSYDADDIFNGTYDPVPVSIVNGKVAISLGVPGDISGDEKVNNKDCVLLFRYIAGWNEEVEYLALDVNGDNKINNKDAIDLFRFCAGWQMTPTPYAVFPAPWHAVCAHNLEAIERIEPSCTEEGNIAYWHCTICERYFENANAVTEITLASTILERIPHTSVTDEAVPATYTSTGLTEGQHCSVCGTVLIEQEVIPMLKKNEYGITYRLYDNKEYLESVGVNNPNPNSYTTEDGLVLDDASAAGYTFDGWYTSGGERVTEIASGSIGARVLYARWTANVYQIQFDSPDVPWEDTTYTVATGRTLTSPTWFGYTFVGWSYNGVIVSSIPPGTTGDITLHANWTSNRNRATAVQQLKEPQIIEDIESGNILFVYEIGQIDNVPLSWDEQNVFPNTEGININKEVTYEKTVDDTQAVKIANTVANATTKSSSWTLSEEWNNSTTASNEHDEQVGKTEGKVDQYGIVTGKKYYVSNSEGGATSTQISAGGSNTRSSKVTRDASVGISGEYSANREVATSVTLSKEQEKSKEFDWNLGGNYGRSQKSSLGANLGVQDSGVSAGISAGLEQGSNWGINGGIGGKTTTTTTTGIETGTSQKAGDSFKLGQTRNYNVGTENLSSSQNHWDVSSSSSSNWNTTTGYETSAQTSQNSEVSKTISELVHDKYGYSSMESRTEGSSDTKSTGESQTLTDEYASTVEFSVEERAGETKYVSISSSATGFYRLITAGTLHVFAVVGYDVATNSFYTYSYSVLDKERHDYLDYSKVNGLFNDCENGELPFEIPYSVYDYVSVKIGRSSGLRIDENTGIVTNFDSTQMSTEGNTNECVVIPEYISASDGFNKPTAVRVNAITSSTFQHNTNIKAVILPYYISDIPEGAFEGCTSLETVIAYGVTSIGKDAFKGCTSLTSFIVDEFVTELGDNAFANVNEIYVNAANSNVAKAAMGSGAKHLIVAMHVMAGNLDNYAIEIPNTCEFFGILSSGKTCNDLSIRSDAQATLISNLKFANNTKTPMWFTSEKVMLSKVTVENSPGLSLILLADNTTLNLYGANRLNTAESVHGDMYTYSLMSKNITLGLMNQEIDGSLTMTGKHVICGDVTNPKNLTIQYGEGIQQPDYKTQEAFNALLQPKSISFDANGGLLPDGSEIGNNIKQVKYDDPYGELPIPTREFYTFDGWFTSKINSGVNITSDTIKTDFLQMTLYARWTKNTYTLTFNATGGTTSETSRMAICNEAIGSLPTASLDYYSFDGWFTESSGGAKVTTATAFNEDTTVYAHWTIHSLSNWTQRENMPEDAQLVETEYRFDHRYYEESDDPDTMEGWTLYDTQRTAWGDEQGPVYTDPTNGTRNVRTETERYKSGTKTVYKYYHTRNSSGVYSNDEYAPQATEAMHHRIELDNRLTNTYQGSYFTWYGTHTCPKCGDEGKNKWYPDGTATRDVYSTRTAYYYQEPIYTYYFFQDRGETSVVMPIGDEYSNIQTWVRYREK